MSISAISQSMSMSALYGMQRPSASDMANKIMKELDTNSDGVLSTDEINSAKKHAKDILGADANGDGAVTLDELVSDITKKMESGNMPPPPPLDGAQQPSASDMAKKILEELDTNGDGVLSTDEINSDTKHAKDILGADANGDGSVTLDELTSDITKKMANGMQQPSASDMANQILKELDTDGDGQLSTDEISNGGDVAKNILPADTNGDGVVSMAELIAYLATSSESSQTSQSGLNTLA